MPRWARAIGLDRREQRCFSVSLKSLPKAASQVKATIEWYKGSASVRPPIALAILAIGLAILAISLIAISIAGWGGNWSATLFPNVATEIFGIIITVAFVDRILKIGEARDRRIRAKGAYRRIGRSTKSLLETLGWVILGVQSKAPPKRIESVEELLDDDLVRELKFLDPEKEEVGLKLAAACQRFHDSTERVVDNYAEYFPAEYVSTLHDLQSSDFFPIIRAMFGQGSMNPSEHFRRTDVVFSGSMGFFERLRTFGAVHNKFTDKAENIELPLLFQGAREYPGPYRHEDRETEPDT